MFVLLLFFMKKKYDLFDGIDVLKIEFLDVDIVFLLIRFCGVNFGFIYKFLFDWVIDILNIIIFSMCICKN